MEGISELIMMTKEELCYDYRGDFNNTHPGDYQFYFAAYSTWHRLTLYKDAFWHT